MKLILLSGFQVAQSPSHSENCGPTLINPRRSSFGLLEPLLAASTVDTENNLQQTRSTYKPFHHSCRLFPSTETNNLSDECKNKSVASSDSFLSFISQQKAVKRRGSLPTDLNFSGEKKILAKESSEITNQPKILLEHARRRGTTGDLLSVLIGPSGMLNTMHGIISGQRISEGPCAIVQESSRRRSGGLEMLGGLWRPRTNDMGIGMASKLNLQCQLMEAWSSWKVQENKFNPQATTAIDPHLKYQQRRGSVPLNMSLLSMKTGEINYPYNSKLHILRKTVFE